MAQVHERLKQPSSTTYAKKTKKLTLSTVGHGRPIIVFFLYLIYLYHWGKYLTD